MREYLIAAIGTVGAAIISSLGGWDLALQTLVMFMAIDYVTGLVVAGVFKKSKKSASGGLDSSLGFKGIIKKSVMLMVVFIGYQLDNFIGADFARYAVIIAFLVNESISIIENVGLMGIPIPNAIKKAITILSEKGE